MKFLSFSFENYKGIAEETTVYLSDLSCLVGNNESGKTTILKGIELIGKLCRGYTLQNGARNSARPKSDSFTGDIVLSAEMQLNNEEQNIASELQKSNGKLKLVFLYSFSNSQFTQDSIDIVVGSDKINVKAKKDKIINFIKEVSPEIIYYDDFKFDVPDKIRFLKQGTNKDEKKEQDKDLTSNQNKLWQDIFDDLLNGAIQFNDSKKHTFQEEIIDWSSIKNIGDTDTVSQRLNKVNNYLNKVVNDDWKDITGGNSVFERFYIERDPNCDSEGFVDFTLRAKTQNSIFKIPERSKGCRWFFCFKVYTEIRSNRNKKGVIFLLDEPASNLHIHPQEKILDSLLELSKKENVNILYSTHSPFLIDSNNFDNTFIVSNKSSDSEEITKITLCKLKDYNLSEKGNDYISIQPIINNIGLNILNKDENSARRSAKDAIRFVTETFPQYATKFNSVFTLFKNFAGLGES